MAADVNRRRVRWRPLGVLFVVAALALAGCGGPVGAGNGPDDPATGPLLAFTATTLDGRAFDGLTLTGKPTVLWFWAPWCPTCLQQAPGVRTAVERYAGKVNIIGIAGLDKTEAMPEFVRLAKVGAMVHVADEAGTVWKRFKVSTQSTFVFLNAAGEITFRGQLGADEVPDRVAALLG